VTNQGTCTCGLFERGVASGHFCVPSLMDFSTASKRERRVEDKLLYDTNNCPEHQPAQKSQSLAMQNLSLHFRGSKKSLSSLLYLMDCSWPDTERHSTLDTQVVVFSLSSCQDPRPRYIVAPAFASSACAHKATRIDLVTFDSSLPNLVSVIARRC
jgi:hypothetical protein